MADACGSIAINARGSDRMEIGLPKTPRFGNGARLTRMMPQRIVSWGD
ncbi:MAG: hypothetical protein V7650_05205 [Parasphingorhabdus sp.]